MNPRLNVSHINYSLFIYPLLNKLLFVLLSTTESEDWPINLCSIWLSLSLFSYICSVTWFVCLALNFYSQTIKMLHVYNYVQCTLITVWNFSITNLEVIS